MKKQILLLSSAVFISGFLGAQHLKKINSKVPSHVANVAVPYLKNIKQDLSTPSTVAPYTNVAKTSAFTMNTIGNSYYDLQSNSSVGDRIVVNQDGSIAAVWTFGPSSTDSEQPDRGTGYAYFNGTAWSAMPTARIESSRTGWGNIVNTRSGKELVLAHDVNDYLRLSSRPAKGTGVWAENAGTAIPNANAAGNFWPRMVASGDTVYAIAVTQYTGNGAPLFKGMKGAVVFSRSTDAGATWDIVNKVPTGIDTSNFTGLGGDSYAITAKGATVAIVAGSMGKDVVMSKSTDAGQTWTPTNVWKFPIKKWDPATQISDFDNDNIADTIYTNDGTFTIGLDNNNQAYVFHGLTRVLQTTPQTTGAFSFFPGIDGLIMWKEAFGVDTGGVLVAEIEDLGTPGIYFPTPSGTSRPYGSWDNSLTSYPSVAFDANNVMYLSYSSIVDSLISIPNQEKVVRQIFVKKSTDGGATWTSPCNVVGMPDGLVYEGMFASMAKLVDGNIHLIYQRDLGAGGVVGSPTTPSPDEADNLGQNNEYIYFKLPVAEIGTCNLAISVKEVLNNIESANLYPNPASTKATLSLNLKENKKVTVSIINAVGQTVYSNAFEGTIGNNKTDINLTGLTNGLYFYQATTGSNHSVSGKFVIEK